MNLFRYNVYSFLMKVPCTADVCNQRIIIALGYVVLSCYMNNILFNTIMKPHGEKVNGFK